MRAGSEASLSGRCSPLVPGLPGATTGARGPCRETGPRVRTQAAGLRGYCAVTMGGPRASPDLVSGPGAAECRFFKSRLGWSVGRGAWGVGSGPWGEHIHLRPGPTSSAPTQLLPGPGAATGASCHHPHFTGEGRKPRGRSNLPRAVHPAPAERGPPSWARRGCSARAFAPGAQVTEAAASWRAVSPRAPGSEHFAAAGTSLAQNGCTAPSYT